MTRSPPPRLLLINIFFTGFTGIINRAIQPVRLGEKQGKRGRERSRRREKDRRREKKGFTLPKEMSQYSEGDKAEERKKERAKIEKERET